FVKIIALSVLWGAIGCGGAKSGLTADEQQELDRLREENQAIAKLQVENQQLPRLRRDNLQLQAMRGNASEVARLRAENTNLIAQLTALNGGVAPVIAAITNADVTEEVALPRQPIQNLPQAFADAAIVVLAQGAPAKEEDVPKPDDNIF